MALRHMPNWCAPTLSGEGGAAIIHTVTPLRELQSLRNILLTAKIVRGLSVSRRAPQGQCTPLTAPT
jgi:hypothetical protein